MTKTGQVEPDHHRSSGHLASLDVIHRVWDLRGYLLVVLGGVMMVANVSLIFWVAPTDSILGDVQRVFYFHVPIAVMSFLAFFVVFVASIIYLVKRTLVWDRLGQSSAEVGVVFVTLALMLPFTFTMTPIEALAFLLGMHAVTATTGDITSVLFGIPGEGTSAATIVDGHPMAKRGEAGRALGAALMSSLVGAWIGAAALAGSGASRFIGA